MTDPGTSSHPRVAADGKTPLTLLRRLRGNDGDAWSRLVYLYGPLVRSWAAARGVVGADAEDVAQEVFLAVSGGLSGFRRDNPGDTFRGWIFGITRNVLLRHAGTAGRGPRAVGGSAAQVALAAVPDAPPGPLDAPDPPAEVAALYRRAIGLVRGEFEGRTWQMFWEVVANGRTPADVAAELGVSPAAVRQAKSRLLRRLREELGDVE